VKDIHKHCDEFAHFHRLLYLSAVEDALSLEYQYKLCK